MLFYRPDGEASGKRLTKIHVGDFNISMGDDY
jgi:hypothetical protein